MVRGYRSTMYVLTVGLLVLVLASVSQASYEYSGLCTRLCSNGRGGNLCRCSAVHFAGKRTGTSYVIDTSSGHATRDLASPMDAYLLSKSGDRQTDRRWKGTEDESRLLKQLLPHLQNLYDGDYYNQQQQQQQQLATHRRPSQLELASLLQDEENRLQTETTDDLDLHGE